VSPTWPASWNMHAETAHNVRQKVYHILRRIQQRSLDGVVEADETYVGGKRPNDPSGRGTSKQCVVALVENKHDQAGKRCTTCSRGATRCSAT